MVVTKVNLKAIRQNAIEITAKHTTKQKYRQFNPMT